MIRLSLVLILLLLCEKSYSVSWGELTFAQRTILVNYRSVWHFLLPGRQKILEAGAFRIAKADDKDFLFFQEKHEEWLGLRPDERRELLARWALFEQLDFQKRKWVKGGLRQLKKLPKGKRESIRYQLMENEE